MNKDFQTRDSFLEPYFKAHDQDMASRLGWGSSRWAGGISHFKCMPAGALRYLIKEGFMNPEDTQNDSPSAQEILDFMEEWGSEAEIFAHGYAVSIDRADYRISVEGIEGVIKHHSAALILALRDTFEEADEFEIHDDTGAFRIWYD